MRVIVEDANIIIDLIKLGLFELMPQLDFDFHTTDFVLEELLDDQQKNEVIEQIASGNITLIQTESDIDFAGISLIYDSTTGLSFEDCSVWYYSDKLAGILLTGDGRLRKQASSNGIEVKGILYIFDIMLEKALITFEIAIEKISELYHFNQRLPVEEKVKRVTAWHNKEFIL